MLKRDHDYYFQAHQQIHTAESAYLDFIVFVACRTGVIFLRISVEEGRRRGKLEARVAYEGRFAKKSRPSPYHCSSCSGVQI